MRESQLRPRDVDGIDFVSDAGRHHQALPGADWPRAGRREFLGQAQAHQRIPQVDQRGRRGQLG